MADLVTKQELENAKIDVKHAGEAVNEKKIVNPRYGAPFKSLPFLSDELEAKANELKSAIKTIIIDNGIPALVVVTANGETLEDIANSLVGAAVAPDLARNRKLRVIAGSVRNTGDGWKWISDNAHTPVGVIPEVSVSGLSVRIDYGFTAKRVVSLVAVPDETFAGMGLTVGGSVGTEFTNLSIAAPLEFSVDIGTGAITAPAFRGSNITTAETNGALVITHPRVNNDLSVFMQKIGSASPIHSDIVLSPGATQITLYGGGNIDGRLSYDGNTWAYAGEMRSAPSVAFNSATGELTVTHTECDQYNISIVPMMGGNRAVLTDVSSVNFKVKFLDVSNIAQLAVPSGTAFIFSRKANIAKTRRKGLYGVRRGYAAIGASDLVSASGNIWIYGVMEV